MKVFFDSSAFAKRFIEEKGSQEVENICSIATELGLSIIGYPEILSALNRRLREKNLSSKDYELAKNRLVEEVSDCQIINISANVISTTESLLENNFLRTLDALQIACAVEGNFELFVTSDKRQAQAVINSKIKTKLIE